MRQRNVLMAVMLVFGLVGCGSSAKAASTATTAIATSTTISAGTATPDEPSSTNTIVPTTVPTIKVIPVAVSAQLSSVDQDSSILVPSFCRLEDGTLTAQGTFSGGFVPETYTRYGDVVELYAYSGQKLQVVELQQERPFTMGGAGPWTVAGPVDSQVGEPQNCFVAVQSTHAFMGAGNAGG